MSIVLNSGLKIFDIIKALLENPDSRKEVSRKLKEKNFSSKTKTITKYLTTLRKLGFEIKTFSKNNYEITKTPFKINIDEEINGFVVFKKALNEIYKYKEEDKKKFEHKINNLVEFSTTKKIPGRVYLKSSKKTLLNYIQLKKFIQAKEKISFSYGKEKIIALPIRIRIRQNGFFLDAYLEYQKKTQIFKIEHMNRIKICNMLAYNFELSSKTVFRLTGALMKNYILREGETAHYKKNNVSITNFYEEKEELFSRLLKYKTLCKIVSPKKEKLIFINKLNNLLDHYKSM